MGKIYAVANQKGGVGKTTTSVNTAVCLAEAGATVLLIDLDPQCNATHGLGERGAASSSYDIFAGRATPAELAGPTHIENLYLIPSTPDIAATAVELPGQPRREHILAEAIEAVTASYDFIFIDCPPSLCLLTLNALVAADRLMIPVQCEYYALEGLSQLLETVAAVRQNLNPRLQISGLLMTMFDPRTNLSNQVVNEVRSHFPELIYRTVIPRNVRLSEAPSHGMPISRYDPTCAGSDAYFDLATEVVERE